MSKKKNDVADQLDILCSIWILASNDENPLITYEGLKYRLGLPEDFDIHSLVHNRSELFRKTTPQNRLDDWKKEMLQGKRLPSWVSSIENKEEREMRINELSVNDVFRSQFRVSSNSPKSDINIINWGLEHIDRLRKAKLEKKQERNRVLATVVVPILSLFIAVSSVFFSFLNNQNQTSLRRYEVELKPKQEGYVNYMKAISESFFSAQANDRKKILQSLNDTENSLYILEPFLPLKERNRIWNQYQQFSQTCYKIAENDSIRNNPLKSYESFSWYRDYFKTTLYESLFGGSLKNNKMILNE